MKDKSNDNIKLKPIKEKLFNWVDYNSHKQ